MVGAGYLYAFHDTGVTRGPSGGPKGVGKNWSPRARPATRNAGLALWLAATLAVIACGDYSRQPSQGEKYCRSHPESSDCRYEHCANGDIAACQKACSLGVLYGCERLEWECQERESEYCPETRG